MVASGWDRLPWLDDVVSEQRARSTWTARHLVLFQDRFETDAMVPESSLDEMAVSVSGRLPCFSHRAPH
jgi:hypothetical protein